MTAACSSGAELCLNAPAGRVTLRGCGRSRFAGRIQRCEARVDADAASPMQQSDLPDRKQCCAWNAVNRLGESHEQGS